MDNQKLYTTCLEVAEELSENGGDLEEILMDIYATAIQLHSVPSPGKCDCKQEMLNALKEVEKLLKGYGSKLDMVMESLSDLEKDLKDVWDTVKEKA